MASSSKAVARPSADSDPARCPLCGKANDCRLCTVGDYKVPCWCEAAQIPTELVARVPANARNRACICRSCVVAFHEERVAALSLPVVFGDYYVEPDGRMVFTAAYLLRRGYCCASNCRHCPYPQRPSAT